MKKKKTPGMVKRQQDLAKAREKGKYGKVRSKSETKVDRWGRPIK